jgi:hypothetical protein
MTSQSHAIDDETLVAFLDGELEREHAERIASSIARDTALQKRLDELRATWDLLNEMPEIKPQRDLTQSTIAMVAQLSESQRSDWKTLLRRYALLLTLIATTLSLATGAGVGALRSSLHRQQILDDLVLLDRYRQMTHVESVEWLEKLASLASLKAAAQTGYFSQNLSPVPRETAERLAWLQVIDEQRRGRITDNLRSFQQEEPERKKILRDIGYLLATADPDTTSDALDYSTALSTYAAILERVGTAERTHLLAQQDVDKRANYLNEVLVPREVAFAYARRISAADQQAIRFWIDQRMAMTWLMIPPESDMQVVRELVEEKSSDMVSEDQIERLKASLSEHAQNLLAPLTPRLQRDALGLWMIEVIEPTSEELLQRFDSLTLDKQSELEFLDERQAQERLKR